MNTATVGAPATERLFDPRAYFKSCSEFYMWSGFIRDILFKQSEPMMRRGLEGVKGSVLTRDMSTQEIIDEILGGIDEVSTHAFTLDQVADLLDLQPYGKGDGYLNPGKNKSTVVFVLIDGAPFIVEMDRGPYDEEWHLLSWSPDEIKTWHVGDKVLRNTILVI